MQFDFKFKKRFPKEGGKLRNDGVVLDFISADGRRGMNPTDIKMERVQCTLKKDKEETKKVSCIIMATVFGSYSYFTLQIKCSAHPHRLCFQ